VIAADRWLAVVEPAEKTRRRSGALIVCRWEMAKLVRQIRVKTMAVLCLVVPFLVLLALRIQSAVPQDTLFGQWVHVSGLAQPLVILGFSGQWALPLVTAIVAGDIFSSEDHFGTWKVILTRSRSRNEVFVGKVAAAVGYTLVMVIVLAATSLLAGVLAGGKPLVGLSGQMVPTGRSEALIVFSWLTQIAPLLTFTALAILISIASRNSVLGVGGPVVLGLVLQLVTLVNMPEAIRVILPSTPFVSWHGLWLQTPFYGPLREGLLSSRVWFIACIEIARVIFRYRSIEVS
jgi:ABC-2 type transport system permease protein